MSGLIVFPGELPEVATTVYGQIVQLRSIDQSIVTKNLKGFLKAKESLAVAMVLINDDPSQMRVVAKLPTMILEELKAARLVSARLEDKMREVERSTTQSHVGREEFNEVAKSVNEFPKLIVQAKLAIIEELKAEVATHADQTKTMGGDVQLMSKNMAILESTVQTMSNGVDGLANMMKSLTAIVNRTLRYLTGLGSAMQYVDPYDDMEARIGQALFKSR